MSLAQYIDHTVLKNTTANTDVDKLCSEALQYGFAAVCVPPYFVSEAKKRVRGSAVKVATVIGFPFGYHHYKAKGKEAELAVKEGADELDLVMNLSAFKSHDAAYLETEIDVVSRYTADNGKTLKVIIESGLLSEEEIIRCCERYRRYPVQFLKTSTGYAEKGASVHAVQLMRRHLPPTIQIKASGGIKTAAFAKELIQAGATRLGTSAGVALVNGDVPLAVYAGNEGYAKTIYAFPGDVRVHGDAVPYENGRDQRFAIEFENGRFTMNVDDHVITGLCRDADHLHLKLRAGDFWSKGTTEFWDFHIEPLAAPSSAGK